MTLLDLDQPTPGPDWLGDLVRDSLRTTSRTVAAYDRGGHDSLQHLIAASARGVLVVDFVTDGSETDPEVTFLTWPQVHSVRLNTNRIGLRAESLKAPVRISFDGGGNLATGQAEARQFFQALLSLQAGISTNGSVQ